jgi:hypothetical protein
MVQEQQARRRLAANAFDSHRIECIFLIITDLLTDQPVLPGFVNDRQRSWWIAAGGAMCEQSSTPTGRVYTPEAGDIYLSLAPLRFHAGSCSQACGCWPEDGDFPVSRAPLRRPSRCVTLLHLYLHPAETWRTAEVEVGIRHDCDLVTVDVIPANDHDLEPVAFVHALLWGGLGEFLRDNGLRIDICVRQSEFRGGATPAGLKAQIAPLLPYASRYFSEEERMGRLKPIIKECIQIKDRD